MTRARVLLVEDDRIRLGIRRFLEGFEVAEAETCQAAAETFRARPADAVLQELHAYGWPRAADPGTLSFWTGGPRWPGCC